MLPISLRNLLTLWLNLFLVFASPLQSLQERQDTCGNTGAIFVAQCWTSESVAFYLSDPAKGKDII